MSTDVVFCLFYLLIILCALYPPDEFVSAGFTIENVFSPFLGSEAENFVNYHIKRTCVSLLIYSLLPLGFVFGLMTFGDREALYHFLFTENGTVALAMLTVADILPLIALVQIYLFGQNWEQHPILKNLLKFGDNQRDLKLLISEINRECRSIEKVCVRTNPICKVIATENWVVKVTPLTVLFAHQSDSNFIVSSSDTHHLSHLNSGGGVSQFVTVDVQSRRGDNFKVRLNSLDFRDFQDRIARTIAVSPEVRFHKNLVDKFLDAFKEAVVENEPYKTSQELENCIGCLQATSNVKIQKLCEDNVGADNRCTTCSCKPMWCVDCLGKWFAHKQDVENVGLWLSCKCTCPMCRANFCVLDVCMVERHS